MILLKADGISKSYAKTKILDGIDVEIVAGKLYALLGHNGAGKSTLMKILMRKEGPDTGRGTIFGASFESNPYSANESVAYVSEDTQFDLDLAIGEFGSFFAKLYRNWNQNSFTELLTAFQLPADARPQGISRGQKMQLGFCVAVASQPKLLLVDEVTSVLDAGARLITLREVMRIRERGGSVVVATNIVTDVQAFADEVWLLQNGKISLRGSPAELTASFVKYRVSATDIALVQIPASARMVGANSDRSFSFLAPKREVSGFGGGKFETDRREITLEEMFVFYTRERQ